MDGPFMTLLPYGKSGNYLLYNVEHNVIERRVEKILEPQWLDPSTAPFAKVDRNRYFKKMIDACKEYVPVLEQAEVLGILEGPRMVFARRSDTDARPSLITEYDYNYFTVISGKIDHCIWVAEDICEKLSVQFGL